MRENLLVLWMCCTHHAKSVDTTGIAGCFVLDPAILEAKEGFHTWPYSNHEDGSRSDDYGTSSGAGLSDGLVLVMLALAPSYRQLECR